MSAGMLNVGGIKSSTVTVAAQVEVLPLVSSTVKTTAFGPTSAQVKAVISSVKLAIAQLSLEPLST